MEKVLARIADALERLAELKEIEIAGVEADDADDTGDDVQPAHLTYLNGQPQ